MLIKVNAIPAQAFTYDPASRTFTSSLGNMPDKVLLPIDTEHPGLGFSIKGKQHTVTYVLHRDTEEALHFLPAPEERMVSGATKVVLYK